MYIGKNPNLGQLYNPDVFSGTGSQTTFTLTNSVTSDQSVIVSISGVKQQVSTYSISGFSLVFGTAPPTATNNIEVQYLGSSIDVGTVGSSAIGASQIASNAVTTAKIIANAVDETKLKDALIGDFTEVVVSASDSLLIGDATDGNTKRDTVQGILDLASHTGNVAFPASQSASGDANTLDDYEEGTWTPVYAQGTNLGTTSGAGKYTKIGDLVYCTFQATCSNLNSMSGSCKINGIPFTSANNGTYPAGAIGYMSSLNTSAGYSIHFFMNPNTAFLELYLNDVGTGVSGLQASELSTGGQMFGSISFKV